MLTTTPLRLLLVTAVVLAVAVVVRLVGIVESALTLTLTLPLPLVPAVALWLPSSAHLSCWLVAISGLGLHLCLVEVPVH